MQQLYNGIQKPFSGVAKYFQQNIITMQEDISGGSHIYMQLYIALLWLLDQSHLRTGMSLFCFFPHLFFNSFSSLLCSTQAQKPGGISLSYVYYYSNIIIVNKEVMHVATVYNIMLLHIDISVFLVCFYFGKRIQPFFCQQPLLLYHILDDLLKRYSILQ